MGIEGSFPGFSTEITLANFYIEEKLLSFHHWFKIRATESNELRLRYLGSRLKVLSVVARTSSGTKLAQKRFAFPAGILKISPSHEPAEETCGGVDINPIFKTLTKDQKVFECGGIWCNLCRNSLLRRLCMRSWVTLRSLVAMAFLIGPLVCWHR